MTKRTLEYSVSRTPELGVDFQPRAGLLPLIDASEPDFGSEKMLINLGPQHPATHGVLRLVLELDGETVVRCIPHIGYLHSSFEKLGEYRDWNQIVTLTDRMDYLAPLIYNCAYAMAVEKMMGLQVTERCKVVRVVCMELDRIFSHLLWLGTWAIDVGAFTPFLYAFQERERVYKLHEAFTGARITTSATRIGGMMADIPEGSSTAQIDTTAIRQRLALRFLGERQRDQPEHRSRDQQQKQILSADRSHGALEQLDRPDRDREAEAVDDEQIRRRDLGDEHGTSCLSHGACGVNQKCAYRESRMLHSNKEFFAG